MVWWVLHLYVSFDRIYISFCGFTKMCALAGTNMTTYRIELRVEFLFVILPFCILLSIFLLVQRTIGYSVYACLCHKYVEQVKKKEKVNSIRESEEKKNKKKKNTNRKISYKYPKHTQSTGIHSFRST